jgi:hypothetical protein
VALGSLQSVSVEGLVLTVSYSWSSGQCDLDSGIYFLGSAKGINCSPASDTYLTFSGDDYGCLGGEAESYLIYLGKAFADKKWTGSTTVLLAAGWNEGDEGKATVTMSTKRFLSNGSTAIDNNAISFAIDPTERPSQQCSLQIAVANVALGADGKVTITVAQ